jgi:phytol kinase
MIEYTPIAIIITLLVAGLCGVQWLGRRLSWPAEWSRKIIHLMMGFSCASFPWIFQSSISVWITSATAILIILCIRSIPLLRQHLGDGLLSITRVSYGDLLFAPSVALVFAWSQGRPAHFLIPVLLLTIADAAGALIGVRYGIHQYQARSGKKTVEGSAAFFFSALSVVFCINYFMAGETWETSLLVAIILACLTMMIEAIADRGFDNLTIPIASYILYDRLHQVSIVELRLQAILLTLLLALLWSTHRKTSLTGGALQSAILLCYGSYVIGASSILPPLLLIYALHILTTHRHGIANNYLHGLSLIIALAIPIILSLSLYHIKFTDLTTCSWMILAASCTHIALIKRATNKKFPPRIPLALTIVVTLACLAILLPLMRLPLSLFHLTLIIAILLIAILLHEKTLKKHHPDSTRILHERTFFCLIASLSILFLEIL